MKLCTILVALFTFFYCTSGGIIPTSDSYSQHFGQFGELSKKIVPSLDTSKRLHVSVVHEMFCENFRPDANLVFVVDLDGALQESWKVPPQVMSVLQLRCQTLRGVGEVKPIVMKIKANVVERDIGRIIMRNEVRISNGVGALVPLFSTFTVALLFLALYSKSN